MPLLLERPLSLCPLPSARTRSHPSICNAPTHPTFFHARVHQVLSAAKP